ncbi:MAG: glycosyltransferase family 4 protein [Anaerolineae bacterium]|nr:glycosyltransferase family 4 protein [Thermoflexus sp.]MDW8064569.1 glycosyltransferase family 4 protein [Anaerolineae bacterium]
MRILHIVHQYPPDRIGGVELYTQAISLELVRRGHAVGIFYRRSAPGRGMDHRAEAGIQMFVVWDGVLDPARRLLANFGDAFIQEAFARVLSEFRPDVIHVQHLMGLPISLLSEARRRGIPLVITLHDYWWVCLNAQLLTNYSGEICAGPRGYWNCARCMLARAGRPWLWPALPFLAGLAAWRNRMLRWGLDAAQRIIAPAVFVREWYVAQGLSERKIVTLPFGVHRPSHLSPSRKEGEIRFAYIGGLAWQKGVHVLVKAFSEVSGNATLWIAGDETFDPAYVAYLRALASPKVRFLGRLDRAEVWDILAQVDVVVVPSLWHETFSFLISEAFSVGLPVLASRLGALAERVRHGVDGLLILHGDVRAWREAIQQLIDQPEYLIHLRAGVQPPMTMEEHRDRLERLYMEIICEDSA